MNRFSEVVYFISLRLWRFLGFLEAFQLHGLPHDIAAHNLQWNFGWSFAASSEECTFWILHLRWIFWLFCVWPCKCTWIINSWISGQDTPTTGKTGLTVILVPHSLLRLLWNSFIITETAAVFSPCSPIGLLHLLCLPTGCQLHFRLVVVKRKDTLQSFCSYPLGRFWTVTHISVCVLQNPTSVEIVFRLLPHSLACPIQPTSLISLLHSSIVLLLE